MGRLLLVVLALLTVGCLAGSKPLPDAQLLRTCKSNCSQPGFCVHDGHAWSCVTPMQGGL
jgi:hypothetical protein